MTVYFAAVGTIFAFGFFIAACGAVSALTRIADSWQAWIAASLPETEATDPAPGPEKEG